MFGKKNILNTVFPALDATVSVAKDVVNSVSKTTRNTGKATRVVKSVLGESVNNIDKLVDETYETVVEAGLNFKNTVGKIVHRTVFVLITNYLIHKLVQTITALFGTRNTDTFKYKITQAKKNAVNVGIYSTNSEQITTLKIESTQGIANDVKYNQWQYT